MKKIFWLPVLTLWLCSGVVSAASPVSAEAINEQVKAQRTAAEKDDVATIPLNDGAILYLNDATTEDIQTALETGAIATSARTRLTGYEPTTQAFARLESARWSRDRFAELRQLHEDLTFELNEVTKHADENPTNSSIDVVTQLTRLDEMLFGPLHKKSDPDFSKTSSNVLDARVDVSSQVGDLCQSVAENQSSITLKPFAPIYQNACQGDSMAEKMDCIRLTLSQINAEAKDARCNSTQILQATSEPDRTGIAGILQASTTDITYPACPTAPREAESHRYFPDLVAAQRNAFQLNARLGEGAVGQSFALQAPALVTKNTQSNRSWYQKYIAWLAPLTTTAQTVVSAGAVADSNELKKALSDTHFDKWNSDFLSYADMAPAQDDAHKFSQMMENLNQFYRTQHQLALELEAHFTEISQKTQKPF